MRLVFQIIVGLIYLNKLVAGFTKSVPTTKNFFKNQEYSEG